MSDFNTSKGHGGAGAVDWVVLTAAILILGAGIFTAMQGNIAQTGADTVTTSAGN